MGIQRWLRAIICVAFVTLRLVAGQGSSEDFPSGQDVIIPRSSSKRTPVPNRYIVQLKTGVSTSAASSAAADVTASNGAVIKTFAASDVINAFVIDTSKVGTDPQQEQQLLEKLKQRPDVLRVFPDYTVKLLSSAVPLAPGQTPSTGVRRIGAVNASTAAPAADVAVAIIDTGVSLDHPDLNVIEGKNCVDPSKPPDDDNEPGHGTHCAGIVAAKNNAGVGVLGVAPGTRIVPVKVFDADGVLTFSNYIECLQWTASNAARLNIKVASMSLGGTSEDELLGVRYGTTCDNTNDLEQQALCGLTRAGVTPVVAAGNNGGNIAATVPARHPEVLTVTSITDVDGKLGGVGQPCRTMRDDVASFFSNYASTSDALAMGHVIAGPGGCINSTTPNNTYTVYSGTSMAAPHVAGVVALCYGNGGVPGPCASKKPSEVIQYIRTAAEKHTLRNLGAVRGASAGPAVSSAPSSNCLGSTTGLSKLANSTGGDVAAKVVLPFNFTYVGANYGLGANGGIYVGSNSYITFGGGSTEIYDLGSWMPGVTGAIHIGSNDNSAMGVWAGAAGAPAGCYRVQFQGCASMSCSSGAVNIRWEMTFCRNGSMALCVAQHGRVGGVGESSAGHNRTTLIAYKLANNIRYTFSGFGSRATVSNTNGEGFVGDPSNPISGLYYGYMAWAGEFIRPPQRSPSPSPSRSPSPSPSRSPSRSPSPSPSRSPSRSPSPSPSRSPSRSPSPSPSRKPSPSPSP